MSNTSGVESVELTTGATTSTSTTVPIPRHKLDPESQSQLEILDRVGALDTSKSVEYIRGAADLASYHFRGDFDFLGVKEEVEIQSCQDSKHKIPLTVLKPKVSQSLNNILIYFHGGGFVFGSRETHMAFCEMLCQCCDCVVVNVDYRLAPEHKFPACYDDAREAIEWCLANKKRLSGSKDPLVGVAGDSAGGNIAATLCHIIPDLDYQILIYPALTANPRKIHASMLNYSEGYLLTCELMLWFRNNFYSTEAETKDILGSPLNRRSFSRLPPALFVVAECDPLADQGIEYKEKLDKAGVKTELLFMNGVIHGFVAQPGLFKETNRKAIASVGSFLSKL